MDEAVVAWWRIWWRPLSPRAVAYVASPALTLPAAWAFARPMAV